jgi:hypothetical protein
MALMRVRRKRKVSEINQMKSVDTSPEKAGVGGSIPSLATTFNDLQARLAVVGCIWLHFHHTLTAQLLLSWMI